MPFFVVVEIFKSYPPKWFSMIQNHHFIQKNIFEKYLGLPQGL